MVAHLALGPGLFSGEIWQPVTSLFFHVDPLSFIFNLIGLWFVGATIERTQGRRRFIALFSTAGVLSNLAIAAVSQLSQRPAVSTGCSYAVLALFVAFGRVFGGAQTQVFGGLYLRARTLAIIFVVWAAVMNLVQGDWAGLAGTVVTTAVGYFVGAPGGLQEAWAALKARRHRRRYRVIEGGGGRPRKKYMN
jgi:membrane associated rhomboid family serine protease